MRKTLLRRMALWTMGGSMGGSAAVALMVMGGNVVAAPAQPPAQATAGNAAQPPARIADAPIVKRLHGINQMEIAAGKTAQTNGDAKAVRDFGAMLVRDHGAADKKLLAYANKAHIDVDALMPGIDADMAKDRGQMDRASTLSGPAFDSAFLSSMVDGHAQAIAMVESARPNVSDPKLRALLGDLLPTLRKHEAMATKLSAKQPAASLKPQPGAPSPAQGRRPAPNPR